jgi:hypothetical protein
MLLRHYLQFIFYGIWVILFSLTPSWSATPTLNVPLKDLQENLEYFIQHNNPSSTPLGEKIPSLESLGTIQDNDPSLRPKLIYTYKDRDHTLKEKLTHVGSLYALGWAAFYLSQPDTVAHEGSWKKYKKNFGDLVFDKDEPVWNWLIHPISGSQMYLFYRANGYTRPESLKMTFIQSALFEFTTEIYTEPASIQDLYQTPVIGTCLGVFLEEASLRLINSRYPLGVFLGHIINPATLFWFYEGRVYVYPQVHPKKGSGLSLYMEF